MRKRAFNKAVLKCPCKVLIVNNHYFRKYDGGDNVFYKELPVVSLPWGRYGNDGKIYVGLYQPNHIKLAVLYHEEGHYYCEKVWGKDQDSRYYKELFASRYSLKKLYKDKFWQSLKWLIRDIEKIAEGDDYDEVHQKTACQLIQEPFFQKLKGYLKCSVEIRPQSRD